MSNKNYLVISDLQIPFHAPGALDFCVKVAREYKCTEILCVGDETDQYFGSSFPKSPEAAHTALSEIEASKKVLRGFYKAFPKVKLAVSNHGVRWVKKAAQAEIPSQLLKSYAEMIEAPAGWVWKQQWEFNESHRFRMIHGCGYSGANGAKNAAIDSGVSTVIGHLHSFGGVSFMRTTDAEPIWAMNTGCLIDKESYAFEYGKYMRQKPTLGCGVILESGRLPIFLPYKE